MPGQKFSRYTGLSIAASRCQQTYFFPKTINLLVPDQLLHMQVTLNIAVPVVACVQMHRIGHILLCKNALYGMVHRNQSFGIHTCDSPVAVDA